MNKRIKCVVGMIMLATSTLICACGTKNEQEKVQAQTESYIETQTEEYISVIDLDKYDKVNVEEALNHDDDSTSVIRKGDDGMVYGAIKIYFNELCLDEGVSSIEYNVESGKACFMDTTDINKIKNKVFRERVDNVKNVTYTIQGNDIEQQENLYVTIYYKYSAKDISELEEISKYHKCIENFVFSLKIKFEDGRKEEKLYTLGFLSETSRNINYVYQLIEK